MTTDLNDNIAIAKGWAYEDVEYHIGGPFIDRQWINPEGEPAMRPDFTGTIEGVAGMMRELNKPRSIWDKTHRWSFYWDRLAKEFVCEEKIYVPEAGPAFRIQTGRSFFSPGDRPGDCEGEAWLSVFGKDEDDPKMP